MVMAIDTVCNLFTEHEVTNGQTGLDEHFLEQIRFPVEWRKGVSIDDYIGMKDRAGIERSLLIAVRAGDQHAAAIIDSRPAALEYSPAALCFLSKDVVCCQARPLRSNPLPA